MLKLIHSIQFWTYILPVVCLSPLAAYLGTLWDWAPGTSTLIILSIPVSLSAFTGNRLLSIIVALVATLACFFELFIVTNQLNFFVLVLPLAAGCVFLLQSGIISTIAGHLNQRLQQLEEQNSQYVRELYRRNREEEKNDTQISSSEHKETIESADASTPPDHTAVNYPMLLLALQDIGRRVSTNLSLDSLIPTIISTAKASLKCETCQVYFWNPQEKRLKNALPANSRKTKQYFLRPNSGMAGWVLEQKQILTRKTVEDDYSLRSMLEEDPHMPDAIAPLAVGEELLGLLLVDNIEQDSATFVRLLYIHANIYALGIKNAQLFDRIEEMARRDGLTGLLNHASFQEELQNLVERASASSTPLTIVMSDVDHFKKFNDTYGHQAGDHVLREVARLWKQTVPHDAVLARYGGEEFICALPQDDLEGGALLAEQLREAVANYPLSFEGQPLQVTASFGVAQLGCPAEKAGDLIRIADESLYRAKENGRNQVVCHRETEIKPADPSER